MKFKTLSKLLLPSMLLLITRVANAKQPPYSVSISPTSALLAAASSPTQFTVHVTKTSDGSDVPGVSVTLGTSLGTLNTLSETTNSTGRVNAMLDPEETPGTGTLTATVTALSVTYSGESSLKVFGGRIFHSGQGYPSLRTYTDMPTTATDAKCVLDAPAQPAGTTWSWSSSANIGITDTSTTNTPGATATGTTATTTTQGQSSDWVKLTYNCEGQTVVYTLNGWTVRTPTYATLISPGGTENNAVISSFEIGYRTLKFYMIEDQFHVIMPDMPMNETFGTLNRSAYPTNDWPAPTPSGNTDPELIAAGGFMDQIFAIHDDRPGYPHLNPVPENPKSPLGTTRINTIAQVYNAGSSTVDSGQAIKIHTMVYYRDHGDQE